MPLDIKNLDWLAKVTIPDHPEFGSKLRQALLSIQTAHNNIELQTNTNSTGDPAAPPQINSFKVSSQNGHFSFEIQDHNEVYRNGSHYIVEHSDNPNFTNPQQIHLGPARNGSKFLGNVTQYFRAYAANPVGPPSQPVYHGGAQPKAVNGGGTVGGPAPTVNQGAGTGSPGVGLVGYGKVQFRSGSGVPPPRKVSR